MPGRGATTSAVPPASTTAIQGRSSSTSSIPSLATTKATRTPFSSYDIVPTLPSWYHVPVAADTPGTEGVETAAFSDPYFRGRYTCA